MRFIGPSNRHAQIPGLLFSQAGQGAAKAFDHGGVNAFVFQGTPEPFDHDIVHPAAFAIHGNPDVGVLLKSENGFITGDLVGMNPIVIIRIRLVESVKSP